MSSSTISFDYNLAKNDEQNSKFDENDSLHRNNGNFKQITESNDNKSTTDETLKYSFLRRSNFWKLSQLFSMAKHNRCTTTQEVCISTQKHQQSQQQLHQQLQQPQQLHQQLCTSTLSTNLSPNQSSQISSSATSGFLQQKLTQPFTALLKQKYEPKNSITQFFIDYKGVEWRAQQLKYQMPTHDVQMLKTQSNEVKFVRNQQRKAQIKPQLFLNKSLNYCCKCEKQLDNGSYGVKISVSHNGNNNNGYNTTTDDEDVKLNTSDSIHPSFNGSTALYHVECFTCDECQQILVDLKAFLYNNISSDSSEPSKVKSNLYCCRHFVELYKPRCQYCDHLIFDEECTEAEGKAWHLGHFCCTECKRSLGGQQYIMANPSKQTDKKVIYETKNEILDQQRQKQQLPYCLTCFDIIFGELCEECGELIGCDVGAISHEGRSWHARDLCFKCNMCSKALLGKPFLPAFDGRIYCSILCSQQSIQKNRYRDRKKPKEILSNNNNNLSKKLEKYPNNEPVSGQSLSPSKPKLRMKANQQNNSEKLLKEQRLTTNDHKNTYHIKKELMNFREQLNDIKLNETINDTQIEKSNENNYIITKQNERIVQNVKAFDQNITNHLQNEQMLDYIQKYQQFSRAPDYVLEYMKQQFIQNESNSQNGIIGAAIEYGSSLSEEERINQTFDCKAVDTNAFPNNDSNYIQTTSSTSSSLNAISLDPNYSIIDSNPLKYRPLVSHSSSSNETTPLLLRPFSSNERSLEERAKQLTQSHYQSKPLLNKKQIFAEQSLPESESPSHASQADQSSNSSYNEHINKNSINHKSITDVKSTEPDTPSTQSTAIHSTSSQTTPETNPRAVNKSVTFDPNVKETVSKRTNRRLKSRSSQSNQFSDNHSCSTCSTCSSSSSSSDDNFDYESTLERNRNQWLGGTKIHYVTNERKKKISNLVQENSVHNESCSIS